MLTLIAYKKILEKRKRIHFDWENASRRMIHWIATHPNGEKYYDHIHNSVSKAYNRLINIEGLYVNIIKRLIRDYPSILHPQEEEIDIHIEYRIYIYDRDEYIGIGGI